MEPKIKELLMKKHVKGEYACELEIEFEPNTDPDAYIIEAAGWVRHRDGSLRNGIELVMDGPALYKDLPQILARPLKALEQAEIADKIRWSARCSTHVHMNVQDWTPTQIIRFVTMWYIFEPNIVEHFAPERAGNLFCLRAIDAPIFVEHIADNFKPRLLGKLGDGGNRRYMGLNWNSLAKFGSLEFRYLRGSVDPEYIMAFIQLLEKVRRWAEETDVDPRDFIADVSMKGLDNIQRDILGYNWPISREIWESLRFAQDLVYGVDLKQFKKVEDTDKMETNFLVDEFNLDEGEL